MNRKRKLTNALVRRLSTVDREYTVRDTIVPTLGVRVHPSGGRSYVHFGEGRKVSLGSASLMTVGRARRESLAILTGGNPDKTTVSTFRDFVVGPWRESWVHRCKPSTIAWRDRNLERQLLPQFGPRRLDCITPQAVHRWFDDYSRTAPGNANHCLLILRHVFNHAIACEHVASNPARRIKPNPRKKITRFLSRVELDRLHRILDRRANDTKASSSQRHQIDIIRLLLLTGCRKNEIVRLRRDEVDGSQLRLRDSKTGPRVVPLSPPAVKVLEELPRVPGSPWVIPGQKPGTRMTNLNDPWEVVRERAGIGKARIHDCRHSFASRALALGESLPAIAKLLGHSQIQTTARYAHLARESVKASAARVAASIAEDFLG